MYCKDSKAYDDIYSAFQLDITNFKYKYTIENFSLRPENTGEEIISPTFVVGSKEKSKWCLCVYSNDTWYNNEVYVKLKLLEPDKVHAKVKFAILNDKEEEKQVFRIYGSAEKNGCGFVYNVLRNFLLDEPNDLLVNDKLTVLCEIEHIYFESGNHENKKLCDVFYTNQTDNYFKYIYTIENFSLRPEKTGEKIISPTFVVGSKERSEWCLHIYPNGKYYYGNFLVYLVLLKPEEVIAVRKCSFLNNKGEEKYVDSVYRSFRKNESLSCDCLINRKSLLNESNGLLFNDKLTILCEVKITELKFTTHKNSIPYDVFYTNQTDVTNFKYKYTIQNFSQRSEKTGKKIISPTFIIGDKERSEWCLWVYPNSDKEESKEYVSVFLILLKPDKAKLKFRLSILDDKKEKNNTCITNNIIDLDKEHGWGFPKFVKKDFLLDKSNGLLFNDNLTILCEAEIVELKSENHENSIPYDVLYTNKTDNYFKYIYTIENFSLSPEETGEKIISPTFVVGRKEKSEWCLHICPNGQDEDSREFISVYLTLLKPNKAKAKYRFSILNNKKEVKNVKFVTESVNFVKDMGLGFSKFVKRDFLLNKSNGLLTNNKLTIQCEAYITDLKTENHDNPQTSMNVSIPQSKLSLDYENLYDPSSFYDCVIKVEDKEFKVHKAVLAAKSSVFCDILKGTSKESQTNIIEIKDFNVEVVRKMVKYIYNDEVSDIQSMANQMFEIANKYELDRLKAISEQLMCNSLNTDNVLERFALSDKYPTERLKKCCEELILKNAECVTTTKKWENFVLLHPTLIGNLFSKLVKINSKESNSEKKE